MSLTCPKCGQQYPCVHAGTVARALSGTAPSDFPQRAPAASAQAATNQKNWREEVVSRVRQHRARRRRFDPDASLELDFQAEPPLTIAASGELEAPSEEQRDDLVEEHMARPQPRKIISFPGPVLVERETEGETTLELGQPETHTPRILDASEPEQIDLLPSFADIQFDEPAAESYLTEELHLPARPAALVRRMRSGLVDSSIVFAALVTFVVCVTAGLSLLAEAVPRSRPALLCLLGAGAILSLLFQYLFLVYGKQTPGMSAANLELLAFDGLKPSPLSCRWRALATTLSAFSLGLGLAWALVDEDTLGWHDRISGTYLSSGDQVI